MVAVPAGRERFVGPGAPSGGPGLQLLDPRDRQTQEDQGTGPASGTGSRCREPGDREAVDRIRVRDDLKARYKNTEIRVDQCVVRVRFTSNAFKFEVQPAFENADGSFDHPDTKAEGWKVTKPRDSRSTRISQDQYDNSY